MTFPTQACYNSSHSCNDEQSVGRQGGRTSDWWSETQAAPRRNEVELNSLRQKAIFSASVWAKWNICASTNTIYINWCDTNSYDKVNVSWCTNERKTNLPLRHLHMQTWDVDKMPVATLMCFFFVSFKWSRMTQRKENSCCIQASS